MKRCPQKNEEREKQQVQGNTAVLGRISNSQSDLTDCAVFPEDVVHLFRGDLEGQVSDIEYPVHLGRQANVRASSLSQVIHELSTGWKDKDCATRKRSQTRAERVKKGPSKLIIVYALPFH
jgi:hypothetical protein